MILEHCRACHAAGTQDYYCRACDDLEWFCDEEPTWSVYERPSAITPERRSVWRMLPRPDRQAATGAPSPVAATQTQRIQGALIWLACPLLWAALIAWFITR